MRNILALGLIVLTSCSEAPSDGSLSPESNPWIVDGELILKDGTPVPEHEVEFLRTQTDSNGQLGAFTFATVRTDSSGRFYFSSAINGTYSAIAKFDPPCIAHTRLGPLNASTKRTVRIVFDKRTDCRIVL